MRENLTEIIFVLDRSGSMCSCKQGTIDGFNSFLKSKGDMKGEVRVSLYQFDDEYDVVYEGKKMGDAPYLNDDTFVPRNMTALYDAVGKTINNVGQRLSNTAEYNRPARVIFVIITDGHENASKEFKMEKIKEMIDHQTSRYNWVFTYLGANQDAILSASYMGISFRNTANYVSSDVGSVNAWAAVRSGTACYTSLRSSDVQVASFFPEDNIKEKGCNEIALESQDIDITVSGDVINFECCKKEGARV